MLFSRNQIASILFFLNSLKALINDLPASSSFAEGEAHFLTFLYFSLHLKTELLYLSVECIVLFQQNPPQRPYIILDENLDPL